MSEAVFKKYDQHQMSLLPESLEDLIPERHLVRVVNEMIDGMNIDSLISTYKGGGTSSYHPRMMIKVLVYSYTQKKYSSREIAKALRENINYMWISGRNRPDFRTINTFRSSRLKECVDNVFASLLELLVKEKLVKIEDYFVDGTKFEADAKRHSYVWKKTMERNKGIVQGKIKELIKHIEEVNAEEEKSYGSRDLEELGESSEITSDKNREKVKEMDVILKESVKKTETLESEKVEKEATKKSKQQSKQISKTKRQLERHLIPKLIKYETQEKILGERNSYSRTDPEATFMRLKNGGRKNGELRACYNVQMGTENQYIVCYSLHQNASDSTTMISHLEKLKKLIMGAIKSKEPKLPLNISADAGYGSEENYEYLEKAEVNAYVKYNTFEKERRGKKNSNEFHKDNLPYDAARDEYKCPSDRLLKYKCTETSKTQTGYEVTKRIYECESCADCSLRESCHKSKDNRRIEINEKLRKYRTKARELLLSETGQTYRKRRNTEIEPTFGDIKQNRQYRRIRLRGKKKANIEIGLISMAHNLIKMWSEQMNRFNSKLVAVAH